MIKETGKELARIQVTFTIQWMKAGGPYRIYPTILSQIWNPPVLIRNSTLESLPRHQEFLPAGFFGVIWRAGATFLRRDFCTRKILNFVQEKSRIFYPQRGSILRPTSRVSQIWPLGYCSGKELARIQVTFIIQWMKAGGPFRISPAILSQIRNPPVLIRFSFKKKSRRTWLYLSRNSCRMRIRFLSSVNSIWRSSRKSGCHDSQIVAWHFDT
jgi:hypothetical protein